MPLTNAISDRGFSGRIDIGHHRGLRYARIGNDQCLVWVGFQTLAKNRMVVGDIRADKKITSAFSRSSYAPGGPSLPNDRL